MDRSLHSVGGHHEAVEEVGIEFDAVGGPTMGADALAVGIAAASTLGGSPPTSNRRDMEPAVVFEGAPIDSDTRVLLVDDVVTTGGSILEAVDVIDKVGATIVGVVTLVDRGDSAGPRIAAHDIAYLPMSTYADLDIRPVRQ